MSNMTQENYENFNLKNIIDELENINKNQLTEINYLFNKCKKLEKANNIYKSLNGNEMPLEVITLRNKNKILESNVKKFDETFNIEMQKRDEDIQYLEVKNFNLENENENLNKKLQDCETLINQLKSEKESLESEKQSLQEVVYTLKNTNDSITKSIEESNTSWFPKLF
jgi:hypothetical protein